MACGAGGAGEGAPRRRAAGRTVGHREPGDLRRRVRYNGGGAVASPSLYPPTLGRAEAAPHGEQRSRLPPAEAAAAAPRTSLRGAPGGGRRSPRPQRPSAPRRPPAPQRLPAPRPVPAVQGQLVREPLGTGPQPPPEGPSGAKAALREPGRASFVPMRFACAS